MFDVTAINLLPDASAAIPDLGSRHVGPLEAAALIALLEAFRRIDPVQNHDADPQIFIQTAAGKFIVRTRHQKLFLYNARDSAVPYTELNAEGILREISVKTRADAATDEVDGPDDPPAKTPHKAIALTILCAGLLLNAYTIYNVFQAESINKKPTVVYISDERESALLHSVAGRYATGDAAGDRALEILSDGRVRFYKVLLQGQRLESEERFRLARQGAKVSLVTPDSGVIEITNIDSVVYYRDTYRRAR